MPRRFIIFLLFAFVACMNDCIIRGNLPQSIDPYDMIEATTVALLDCRELPSRAHQRRPKQLHRHYGSIYDAQLMRHLFGERVSERTVRSLIDHKCSAAIFVLCNRLWSTSDGHIE